MSIAFSLNAKAQGVELKHFWNLCVGAGRANEGLRAAWLEQMRTAVVEAGFRYVRFHGLFHDDMFVYRESEGVPCFNFQYIDELFDRLLDLGIKPFVELGFCPSELARETGTVFWWKANGAPPKDFAKWAALVSALVSHLVGRYGIQEVRTWYFEVWNEPNLNPFFRGTKTEYFELYRVSVNAVRGVDAQLRVGGPATSNFVPDARFDGEVEDTSQHRLVTNAKDLDSLEWRPVWLEQFLEFCRREQLPVDFVSVHPYPTDWALDEHGTGMKLTRGVDATPKDLALVREIVDRSPFPKAEIHLTEWSSSSSPRDFTHDYLQAATYIVKANLESVGLVDSLSYWTFTDVFEEGGAGHEPFHGGFGMINYQGIPKPSFHAYRMLSRLGDELLARGKGFFVTRNSQLKTLQAIVYHYPEEMQRTIPGSYDNREIAEATLELGKMAPLNMVVTGLKPNAVFRVEELSRGHGDVITAWQRMGAPTNLSREQTATLKGQARATVVSMLSANQEGQLRLERNIRPWTVLLLTDE